MGTAAGYVAFFVNRAVQVIAGAPHLNSIVVSTPSSWDCFASSHPTLTSQPNASPSAHADYSRRSCAWRPALFETRIYRVQGTKDP